MFTTRVLRQAAQHAERQPLIKFIGQRSIPASIDHTPKPHPASPEGHLPASFSAYGSGANKGSHSSFSAYRDHAQQHGPLQRSIYSGSAGGVGGTSGAQLGSIKPQNGVAFDVSELPARFRRAPLSLSEIEAVESGGATVFG